MSTSNNTTGSASADENMSSNTYDFIPADRVEVFPLSQVGAKDESGFYTASGTPLKSVGISGVAGSELDVIEQPAAG